MRSFFTKPIIVIALILAVLSGGVFALVALQRQASEIPPLAEEKNRGSQHELIGKSLEGRGIEAYTYGDGEEHLVFVGGIHGGYEWNSVLLAYQFMEYLEENQSVVPDNLTVTVIPSANPDGVYSVVGKEGRFTIMDVPTDTEVLRAGRFNARGVDLNRNFDCEWKPTSMWRSKQVSAGSAPFSEPEAMAIRNFILENDPDAVIFWHSQANAVYASECGAGILPETLDMMNAYSRASGYPAAESFDQYEITGAAEGWLASIGIPTLTVELQTHETIEWERNLAGIKALLGYYSQKTGIGR